MRSLVASLLLLPTLALAVPLEFTHQGTLSDSAGVPLTGDHQLGFALFDAPSSGNELWRETHTLGFEGGVYSVRLGLTEPIDSTDFDGDLLYLELTVDGTVMPERTPIVSVPYAITAHNVDGGTVSASEVSVGGTVVIDASGVVNASELRIGGDTVLDGNGLTAAVSWDDLTDVPTDLGTDTLAELTGCAANDVARYDGAGWTCGPERLQDDASGLTQGVLAPVVIPFGNGNEQVARGDHSHDLSTLTGSLDKSQLPTLTAADVGALPSGTTLDQIAGQLDASQLPTLTAADVGALSTGGGSLSGDLGGTNASFSGYVQVGDSSTTCGSGSAGALRFTAGALELWRPRAL